MVFSTEFSLYRYALFLHVQIDMLWYFTCFSRINRADFWLLCCLTRDHTWTWTCMFITREKINRSQKFDITNSIITYRNQINTKHHTVNCSYLKCSVEPNNYLEFLECLTFNDFTLSRKKHSLLWSKSLTIIKKRTSTSTTTAAARQHHDSTTTDEYYNLEKDQNHKWHVPRSSHKVR